MGLLGVGIEVVQPRHPDITDRTHVGLLARVNSLVDPELSLVVELFITELTLVEELAPVFVLAVLPLAPVLVAGPADGADIAGLVPANEKKLKHKRKNYAGRIIPVYGSDVVLEVILVLGLHRTAGLRTLELDIAVGHSQVDVQVLSSSDKLATDVTGHLNRGDCTETFTS